MSTKPEFNEATVKEFEEKLRELLNQYGLRMTTKLDFPQYRVLPTEVQLAEKVIQNHGGVLITAYLPVKELGEVENG